MDRRKQHAALLARIDGHFQNAFAVVGDEPCKAIVGDAKFGRIVGMDLDERLRQMRAQSRAHSAARHGVPLIADSAGVKPQRPAGMGFGSQRRNIGRREVRLAVAAIEPAIGEEALLRFAIAWPDRPQRGVQRVESIVRYRLKRADIEIPAAIVLERRQCSMLAEYLGSGIEVERVPETEPLRHLAEDPPIGPGFPRRGQKRALPRNSPLRIGHRSRLLAPGQRGQQHMRTGLDGVIGLHILRNYEQFELL